MKPLLRKDWNEVSTMTLEGLFSRSPRLAEDAVLAELDRLLAEGANPDGDAHGISPPLLSAITYNYPGAVQKLVAAGADALYTDSYGRNLLHAAVEHRCDGAFEPLLRAGAKLGAKDGSFNLDPLETAYGYGYYETANALIEAAEKVGTDYPLSRTIRTSTGNACREKALAYVMGRMRTGFPFSSREAA